MPRRAFARSLAAQERPGWRALLQGRAARYVLVGGIGAVAEFAGFLGLTRAGLGVLAGNVLAFHAAFVLCYFLHYHYTHEKPFTGAQHVARGLAKYAALMYLQLAMGSALLWLFIHVLGWRPDASKILQMAIVTPLGYVVQKRLIFRREAGR